MKFTFNKDFVQAQLEMEKETPERILKIDPPTANSPEFKSYTGAFMFSTAKHMELMSKLMEEVLSANRKADDRITLLENKVETLQNTITKQADLITALETKVTKLQEDMGTNSTKLDKCKADSKTAVSGTLVLERYTRSFNMRAFNIPEANNENTEQSIKLINETIKRVTGDDITVEYGHRVGKKRDDGKPRAIICRFASRQDRFKIFTKRRAFFDKGTPIYEDLPAIDLIEKKKHAAEIKVLHQQKHKVAFLRGKWFVDGAEFNGGA